MTIEKLKMAKQLEKEIAWCEELLRSDNFLSEKVSRQGMFGKITMINGIDCPDWLKLPIMIAVKIHKEELQEKLNKL